MKSVEGAIVGAGTVLDPAQLEAAVEAGAEFAVSPGLTDRLAAAAGAGPVPLLPGVAIGRATSCARSTSASRG